MSRTRYYAWHILKLRIEAQRRFDRLLDVIKLDNKRGDDLLTFDGTSVRMAVDDFKTLLAELRRLK